MEHFALLDALRRAEVGPARPVPRPADGGPATVCVRIFSGDRMRVVVPEIVGTELACRGFIEPSLTRVMIATLRPGMTFVDVGAQYGYHSLVASRLVGPSGAVVAFEPNRRVLPLLVANTAAAGNIRVEAAAACSATGTAVLSDFGAVDSALSTILPAARVPPAERRRLRAETYRVRAVTLDGHLGDAGIRPHFVKLDAEGAELDILLGMPRLLDEVGPVLAVEVGDYDGMSCPTTAACVEHLESQGYRALEWSGDGLRPHRRRERYGYDNLFFVRDPPPSRPTR